MTALAAAQTALDRSIEHFAAAEARFQAASLRFDVNPTEEIARAVRAAFQVAEAHREVVRVHRLRLDAAQTEAQFHADWAAACETADAPQPIGSVRLVQLDETGPTRWERLRRLLNARCGQAASHADADHDDLRHAAAKFASGGRTESSMRLTEAEMEAAVSYVEQVLHVLGFDLEAADAEYAARRLAA